MDIEPLLIAPLFLLAAGLYAAVGHGGASGYLAVMAILSFPAATMRPTALVLNVIVSLLATIRFHRAGHLRWEMFWPFALASVPFALLGGMLHLPQEYFAWIVSAVLLYAAARLVFARPGEEPKSEKGISTRVALLGGTVIGFLSGLTGIGGGIFLSPLLLLLGSGTPKTAAAVSAAFILVNSLAGLAGLCASHAPELCAHVTVFLLAVLLGGWVGTGYALERGSNLALRRILAIVMVIASVKLMLV
jgi:hypothetical protein